MAALATPNPTINTSPYYGVQLRRFTMGALVTLFALVLLMGYLLPFASMLLISVKDKDQLFSQSDAPVIPVKPSGFVYEGKEYPIYIVPTDSGTKQ